MRTRGEKGVLNENHRLPVVGLVPVVRCTHDLQALQQKVGRIQSSQLGVETNGASTMDEEKIGGGLNELSNYLSTLRGEEKVLKPRCLALREQNEGAEGCRILVGLQIVRERDCREAEYMKYAPYTATELAVLRKNYPTLGPSGVAELLPGRSEKSIMQRAHILHVKINTSRPYDALIEQHYPISGLSGAMLFTGLRESIVESRIKTLQRYGHRLIPPERKLANVFRPTAYPDVPYHLRISGREQNYPRLVNENQIGANYE